MALERLPGDLVWRFWLASPLAFEDWENPTAAEMNANPNNDPDGLIFNITCALNTDGTTFDIGEGDTDDSLTFCQRAGTSEVLNYAPEIVLQIERSTKRWVESDPSTLDDANLAFSLMAWRGVEYFAIMSIGDAPDAAVDAGDRLKMARVATDHLIDEHDSGANVRSTQTPLARGDVNWNFTVA